MCLLKSLWSGHVSIVGWGDDNAKGTRSCEMNTETDAERTTELTVLLVVRFDVCMDAFVLGLLAASFSIHEFV